MKLTIHLHLVLRLRMTIAVSLTSLVQRDDFIFSSGSKLYTLIYTALPVERIIVQTTAKIWIPGN
jgi:hypothetical protein